jgi:hypothetical protein
MMMTVLMVFPVVDGEISLFNSKLNLVKHTVGVYEVTADGGLKLLQSVKTNKDLIGVLLNKFNTTTGIGDVVHEFDTDKVTQLLRGHFDSDLGFYYTVYMDIIVHIVRERFETTTSIASTPEHLKLLLNTKTVPVANANAVHAIRKELNLQLTQSDRAELHEYGGNMYCAVEVVGNEVAGYKHMVIDSSKPDAPVEVHDLQAAAEYIASKWW